MKLVDKICTIAPSYSAFSSFHTHKTTFLFPSISLLFLNSDSLQRQPHPLSPPVVRPLLHRTWHCGGHKGKLLFKQLIEFRCGFITFCYFG